MIKKLLLASVLLLYWQKLVYGQFVEDPNRRLPNPTTVVANDPVLQLPPRGSDPATCTPGMTFFNTTTHTQRICQPANTWSDTGTGGGTGTLTNITGDGHFVITNPTTTPNLQFIGLANDYDFSQLTGTSNVTLWSSGAGAPVGVCIAGRDRYLDTTNSDEWFCSATNTWRKNLSTTNTGVFNLTGNHGTDPCGIVASSQDCISLNANDNLTVKSNTDTVVVPGINGTPINGNCVQWNVSASHYELSDSGAVCGSSGANTALSNLAAVSINTSLLAQTGVDLGSTTKPFRNLFLFGAGTFGSTYFELTGTPTSTRTVTLPDANSVTVIPDTGAANNYISAISAGGVISKSRPACATLSDSSDGCKASIPTSAALTGTDASKNIIAATAHGHAAPLLCLDSSGSGTAQVCTTTPSFTPGAGDTILYETTTTNTGALTLNVNSTSALAVQYAGTALSGNEITLGHYYVLSLNNAATAWDLLTPFTSLPSALVTQYTTHSTNTFTKPNICDTLTFVLYGAGGSGAGGQVKTANATVTLGGTGGGGGAYATKTVKCSDATAPISVVVGTGGASVAASTNGNPGTASTVTINGIQILFAGGGGAGLSNNGVAAISGGSGGGTNGTGVIGSTGTTTGGSPATANGANGISGQGAGGNTTNVNNVAEFGGGAGGGSPVGSGTSFSGGGSINGAPGGGSGGSVSASTVSQNGGDGGLPQSYAIGGGALGGAKCSVTGCTASNGATANAGGGSALAGGGGAGGGACETTTASGTCTAGNGSAGRTPGAGGGGGGGANTNAGTGTAGTGGAGADGYAMVIVN